MEPAQEGAQAVTGSGGTPVSTAVNGSIETNNYNTGQGFDYGGGSYPYTVDPAFDAEVLQITSAGDIVADVTTVSGDTVSIPLAGGSGIIDYLDIASVTFKDPNATGARIAGVIGGDN